MPITPNEPEYTNAEIEAKRRELLDAASQYGVWATVDRDSANDRDWVLNNEVALRLDEEGIIEMDHQTRCTTGFRYRLTS